MSGKSGSFVPTEPRNTYLFRRAKFRSPVPDRRYSPFKEIYFFPAVQFVQKESPCEWKRTFPPLFFSYQLNELFFIHPTTLRHPTFSLFFLPSDTGFCSSASERFLLFFTVSAYLSLFLYSLIPCCFFSATYHPLASDVIFLHENVLSPLLPLHLHLLTVVIFIILHRRFLFLNSYRRFHRYNFTSSCRYSNPISRRLCLSYGFFSFGFYASSDYFFRLSLSIFVSRILASWDYRFWLRFFIWKFCTAYELARVFVLAQEN